jgi:hypothetical protein
MSDGDMAAGAEPAPPSWGGQIEKKKVLGGPKLEKNNKNWGKILIFLIFFFNFFNFFLGRTLGLQAP